MRLANDRLTFVQINKSNLFRLCERTSSGEPGRYRETKLPLARSDLANAGSVRGEAA